MLLVRLTVPQACLIAGLCFLMLPSEAQYRKLLKLFGVRRAGGAGIAGRCVTER